MSKRKAPNNTEDAIETRQSKRITRSVPTPSKHDVGTSVVTPSQPTARRRGRPPKKSIAKEDTSETTITRQSRRGDLQRPDSSSLKENELPNVSDNDAKSDEALPATEPMPVSNKRKVVFDSVEIVTQVTRRGNGRKPVNSSIPPGLPAVSEQNEQEQDTSSANPSKSKRSDAHVPTQPNVQLPSTLPLSLHRCLNDQKLAILKSLNNPPTDCHLASVDDDEPANVIALRQLTSLLNGTITRSEGNSCLLMGPPGSGKSRVFDLALAGTRSDATIVIRLSGNVHTTDRLALREVARQVTKQSGPSLTPPSIDTFFGNADEDADIALNSSELPVAHLPALIASLSSLSRPVVILLDQFEMFTEHARQALLYCLFDAVQSCRGSGISKSSGLAVIGITSRVDVVNQLEKRVKSRFSHRVLRTATMRHLDEWIGFARSCLCADIPESFGDGDEELNSEWSRMWTDSVENFLGDKGIRECLNETFCLSRDVRILIRALVGSVTSLSPTAPFLKSQSFRAQMQTQRNPGEFPAFIRLSYPCLSLLVAAEHVRVSGNDFFTFEMLYDMFRTQVRTSSAAPVQLGGVGIGMVNVCRGVMMGAFEQLVQNKIFAPSGAPVSGLAKEFFKYRSNVSREDVKSIVERQGSTSLKKWFTKGQ